MPNKEIIYLDNAATTKVNNDVLASYIKVTETYLGNASSIHALGIEARDLLEKARKQILSLLHFEDDDLIFTSGATEANNMAIKGFALKHQNRGKHIITSSIEHPSILNAVKQLEENFGFEVTYLPVDDKGVVDLDILKKSIKKETILVSIMSVNNETGVIQPIKEISEILKNYPKICFHTDAVQALGKVDLDFSCADMVTITGHKINGIKGSGALIKKKGISLLNLLSGGEQENGERAGTINLAGNVSFAKAIRIALENLQERQMYVKKLIVPIQKYLLANPDLYEINSLGEENPYIINVSLKKKKAAVVLEGLSERGIMVSSVSACSSTHEKMSYVIKAMHKEDKLAYNTLRFSFSYSNKPAEIEYFLQNLDEIVKGIK